MVEGSHQAHLFWATLRLRSRGSQQLVRPSRQEMLLSSRLSSPSSTWFFRQGACRRDQEANTSQE